MNEYTDKIFGCWAGKTLAGAIGMPFEGVPYQPNLRQENIHVQDVPNDDLEIQLVWLVALERHGLNLRAEHLAKYWINNIKHGCDEYSVALRNIRRGIMPPASGWEDNFFVDGMGAAIRSEIWAAAFPGRPDAAGYFAANDAIVDHWGDGVWSEVFLATAESYLFIENDIAKALKYALATIPRSTRLHPAIDGVLKLYEKGCRAEDAKAVITQKFYHPNFTDCVMNLSFVAYALLWGSGDFIKTVLYAINCGRDTDCTAATCGAFLGMCYGGNVIPVDLMNKLSPTLALGKLIGKIERIPRTLPELIKRTVALHERLAVELPETRYPVYQPYLPGKPAAFDRARWLILDESQHNVPAIKEKLLRTGLCPVELQPYIITTDGLTLDLSKYANCANTLNLFAFLQVKNTDTAREEVMLSATADVGMTLWFDRDRLLNHHSRQLSIPSFHRAEGGAAFHYPLQHGDRKLVHIKLYSCLAPLKCTLMFGNQFNDHLDGFDLSI
ncbi:MAG: ADP-ribosylglycohydrolase family protein [Kiritimatiellaeota bacterium]|nr:ADP-ribosylglycohydrolase family protein [Kiritimatiellota bacterium]